MTQTAPLVMTLSAYNSGGVLHGPVVVTQGEENSNETVAEAIDRAKRTFQWHTTHYPPD